MKITHAHINKAGQHGVIDFTTSGQSKLSASRSPQGRTLDFDILDAPQKEADR